MKIRNDERFLSGMNPRGSSPFFLKPAREAKGETLTPEEEDVIQQRISNVLALRQYTIPVFDIYAEADEEAVSEIFVRVNSKGSVLKQNDFILTLLSLHWDEGRTLLEDFCRQSTTAPLRGEATASNPVIEATPEGIIRVLMAYAFDRARLSYGYKLLRGADFEKQGRVDAALREARFNTMRDKLPQIMDVHTWHEFIKAIMNAVYLTDSLILSTNAVFYTYAFYLIAKDRFGASPLDNLHLTSLWFFCAALTSMYTGSFESVVESQLGSLKQIHSFEGYRHFILSRVEGILTDDYFNITLPGPDGFEKSGARNNAWNAYTASLNVLGRTILFSRSNLLVSQMFEIGSNGKRRAVEKHHLFPKAYLRAQGKQDKEINQIANFAYIDWKDNQSILDKAPSVYYPVVCAGMSRDAILKMEKENALPHGWENMPYEEFLRKRRPLMAAVIRRAYARLRTNAAGTGE